MIASIVAKSRFDLNLVRRVLPPALSRDVEFLAGGGADGIKSMARTRAALGRPIAVLIDSDGSDPNVVRARRQEMEEVVGSVAGQAPLGVIVAVPELEIVFFEAPNPLDRLYPSCRAIPSVSELASLSPRAAIKLIDPSRDYEAVRQRLFDEIREEDLPALRQTSVIQELIDFLTVCQSHHVKFTIEIGPGIPSDLQALKGTHGVRSLVGALRNVLTSDVWGAGQVATASSGDTTVRFDMLNFRVGMQPVGTFPTTFVLEVEGEARAEKTAEPSVGG